MSTTTVEGLRGITAAETRLSRVDGEKGELIYCGYDIRDLAEHVCFEECVALLWDGELPTRARLDELIRQIQEEAHLDESVLAQIRNYPRSAHPMAALRTAISGVGMADAEAEVNDPAANRRKAIRLLVKTPMCAAAFHRHRKGEEPLGWRTDLSFAANVLYLMLGKEPHQEAVDALDMALVLHADHGFNASTFAYRVTIGTEADLYSGATTAMATLKGPLHGGANERVMKMLTEIGDVANVEEYIRGKIERKEKVMGFGHAVYKVLDPRAKLLDESSRRLGESVGDMRWHQISKKIQEVMEREKGLNANVDFFSASTYHYLGIPTDMFTLIFATSRMSGWTAHAFEQQANNKLIRPKAAYVGPEHKTVVPIDQRG